MSIPKGKYPARPVDWSFARIGANATPAVKVIMAVNYDPKEFPMDVEWVGFLTDKAKQRTVESLVLMGFRGSDLSTIVSGKAGEALDITTDVQVEIEHREHKGKLYPRIKWINPLKSFKQSKSIPLDQAKFEINNLNLGEDLAAAQQKLGVKQESQELSTDDIRF